MKLLGIYMLVSSAFLNDHFNKMKSIWTYLEKVNTMIQDNFKNSPYVSNSLLVQLLPYSDYETQVQHNGSDFIAKFHVIME